MSSNLAREGVAQPPSAVLPELTMRFHDAKPQAYNGQRLHDSIGSDPGA
jgi:hypothetical protein